MVLQRYEFVLFVLFLSFADFGHVQVCCLSTTSTPSPDPPPVSESCTAADGTPGLCMHLNQCQSLRSLLDLPRPLPSETISFLRRSVCGIPSTLHVCCSTVLTNRFKPSDVDHLLPNRDSCGLDTGNNKILGGMTTEINEYPWLALVEYRKSNGSISSGCGATLISKRYVITAGHCVIGKVLTQLGTPINIILGEYDKKKAIDCIGYGGLSYCNVGPVVIAIEEITTHPDYQPSQRTQRNDLAIIRLANDAPFSDFINPICLPNSDITTESGVYTYIAGWGSNNDVKVHHQLPLVSLASCQAAYMNFMPPERLWDKQICAGGNGKVDSCIADFGGPFMDRSVSNSTVHWVLYGVLSFRPTPCDLPNMPSVYTQVFPYLEWIKSQIRE